MATKSSGPAHLWSLFCIVCLISCCKNDNTTLMARPISLKNKLLKLSYLGDNLEVVRDIVPVGNISDPC